MRKVLITGGAGFIGFHLAKGLLAAGNRVDLLDNFGRAVRDADLNELQNRTEVRVLEKDLLNLHSSSTLDRDYDAIYHFAAIIGVVHVLNRPYEVLTHNAVLLSNAIELARRQQNLERFIFASTSEVYAGTLASFGMKIPTPEETPLTVSDVSQPRTSYMLSKIHGEAMCHHSNLPFTIVRPHNVYGPRMGMSHVVPELLKRAHESADGGVLQVYSPKHQRTFCYVDDAVNLLSSLLSSEVARGATLNLGSLEPEVSIATVAQTVVDVVGRRLAIEEMPDTPGSPKRRAPDMQRAQKVTGFRSTIGLREGIQRTYQWYRTNVFDGQGASAR